ncbi:MAG: DUF5615 family PIN-like protein [Acidobacteria bacterium]|nr:DUF5615 family PIN-like protein [Acidobacteriota bacterium]
MRLLFDENLSAGLPRKLADCYPGSVHVRDVGLRSAQDGDVWAYAVSNGLAIVSKDADFRQRSYVCGFPPKVIWIRLGNCSTRAIEDLLRSRSTQIAAFCADEVQSFLALG